MSVYWPKAIHWNRGPNLGQTLFLAPHRVVFASLEFPADPDAQAASRLRPPGVSFEDVNPRDYDGTFAWSSLGFQHSTGPYPQTLLFPAMGRMLFFTLNHHAWVIPLWIFPLIFAFIPNLYLLQILRRQFRQNQGLCPTCRYDLRAHNPGDNCPECGTLIPTA